MKRKEELINIPNTLTTIRVLITLIIIYGIFYGFKLSSIAILFIIGMITDCLDGQIARRFHEKTEFGRKFDMAADRFLVLGTVLSLIISYIINGIPSSFQMLQIGIILTREIIGFPFLILGLFFGNTFPNAKFIGKATTLLQAIAFPIILFNFSFAIYTSIITGIFGVFSGITYARDVFKLRRSKKENKAGKAVLKKIAGIFSIVFLLAGTLTFPKITGGAIGVGDPNPVYSIVFFIITLVFAVLYFWFSRKN